MINGRTASQRGDNTFDSFSCGGGRQRVKLRNGKRVFCVAVPSDGITTRLALLSKVPDLSDPPLPDWFPLPLILLWFSIPESRRNILTSQDLNFAFNRTHRHRLLTFSAPPSLLSNYPAPPEEEEGVTVGGRMLRTGEAVV